MEINKQALIPVMNIGKNGITEGVIEQLKKYLKQKKVIKIKILAAYFEGKDKKEIGEEIAEKSDSELVEVRGNTVILKKKQTIKVESAVKSKK